MRAMTKHPLVMAVLLAGLLFGVYHTESATKIPKEQWLRRIEDFRRLVVIPALKDLGEKFHSEAAVELLIGTALVESRLDERHQDLNTYRRGKASGIGMFQIQPSTHTDLWRHWLSFQPELAKRVSETGQRPHEDLVTDLEYAAKIARLLYAQRQKKGLPAKHDVHGMALTWKRYFNTVEGAGEPQDFVRVYNQYRRD